MLARCRLWVALASACVGLAMLIVWFPSDFPPAVWTTSPRVQQVKKAREIADHFGLNTRDWKVYETARVPDASLRSIALRRATLPNEKQASQQHAQPGVSPLSVRFEFRAKGSNQSAEVGLDSTGKPLSWHAPDGFLPKKGSRSEQDLASDAFQLLAAGEAGAYGSVVRSEGDDAGEDDYVWKKQTAPQFGLRDRIKVVVRNSAVRTAERQVYLPTDDPDSKADEDPGYWGVLSPLFGLICTVGTVIVLGIYVLWLARKALNHQFPLRMAAVALLFLGAAFLLGSGREQWETTEDAGPLLGALFSVFSVVCLVAVGRGISAEARSKWITLEQLTRLAPIGRSTGLSILGGVLFSPLLAALPFLIARCGLFPQSMVLLPNAGVLFSRWPIAESIDIAPAVSLLGFFGFGIPALWRSIRFRWICWPVAVAAGTLFFADYMRVVTGPLSAPLVAGFCTLGIYWFVYHYFDLAAVFTLQLASGLVSGTFLMAGKPVGASSLVCGIAILLAAAYWFARRPDTVAAGDPRATIPELVDFRAEREKLKAEFSLARRAQEDMLPDTPPTVDGYSIAASCTPSLEVGGDLYDFLKLPDGRIGIGVADVSGKGVPAALYMTLTKGLLASITRSNSELVSVVEEVNRHLHEVTRKKVFVTMALGFLDAKTAVLECVRAGHNPMVWRQVGLDVTTLVAPGGLGLGITASRVFSKQLKVANLKLSPGDAVVFYSDGITEAMNSDLEQFGEQRLMDAVDKTDRLDAGAARDSILHDVRQFLDGVHPQDDMTIVVLRVESPGLIRNGQGASVSR